MNQDNLKLWKGVWEAVQAHLLRNGGPNCVLCAQPLSVRKGFVSEDLLRLMPRRAQELKLVLNLPSSTLYRQLNALKAQGLAVRGAKCVWRPTAAGYKRLQSGV